MIVYLNGAWTDAAAATISIHDRGFLLADGVFETARVVNGRYFRLEQHLGRLADSARQLHLAIPHANELSVIAHELVVRNGVADGSLRITVTRGPGGSGLDTRGAGPPTLLVAVHPMAPDWRERAARGWHLITANVRRPSALSVPSDLKALGRVYAILAHLEAESAGADDALLLTADGNIGEGPTWNFFWRSGRVLRTAALAGGILEGITRSIIMRLAAAEGYQTEEGLYPRSDLEHADEAFATMTSFGVVPIRSIDQRSFPGDGCAGLLQRRYWEYVERSLQGGGPDAARGSQAGPP